jgi:hypothetical protein
VRVILAFPFGMMRSDTGVCEVNTLFDSGAYKIGQRFGLKRVLAIPTRSKGHGCIQSALTLSLSLALSLHTSSQDGGVRTKFRSLNRTGGGRQEGTGLPFLPVSGKDKYKHYYY